MRSNRSFRSGIGFGQIAATLLVVLPTVAFIVMFLLEYWSVMQADYRLKLIANLTADFLKSKEDLDAAAFDPIELANYRQKVDELCPGNTHFALLHYANDASNKGEIKIVVRYNFQGHYLEQNLSSVMDTYSYTDQNATVEIACQ